MRGWAFLLVPLLPLPLAEKEGPPAPATSLAPSWIWEGAWIPYQGHLRVRTQRAGEEPEELVASVKLTYLGLGPAGGDGTQGNQKTVLLRSSESSGEKDLAVSEAVSLLALPGGEVRPLCPLEDRAARVSPLTFKHLPLWIFPPLADFRPPQGKRPTRLHVLFPEPREVLANYRIEEGGLHLKIEALPGQTLTLLQDGVESPFHLTSLKQAYRLSRPPEAPDRALLLHFESSLEGRFPQADGAVDLIRAEVKLSRIDAEWQYRLEEGRWNELRAQARELEEIERTLFSSLDPDAGESRAAAFGKEHPGGPLTRFAAGLALQAEAVRPIAQERRLYGKPAPDFTLRDLSGKEVTLSRILPGKITLLSFWSVG